MIYNQGQVIYNPGRVLSLGSWPGFLVVLGFLSSHCFAGVVAGATFVVEGVELLPTHTISYKKKRYYP